MDPTKRTNRASQLAQLAGHAPHSFADTVKIMNNLHMQESASSNSAVFKFHAKLAVKWAALVLEEIDNLTKNAEIQEDYESEVGRLATAIKPFLDHEARGATVGSQVGVTSPGEVEEYLQARGVQADVCVTIPRALELLGWGKNGTRQRLFGSANPVSVYRPGQAQIERWADEDAADDLI